MATRESAEGDARDSASQGLPPKNQRTYKYSTRAPDGKAPQAAHPVTDWGVNRGIRLTQHAAARWDERTPPDSVAPETAYDHGVDLPGYITRGIENPDHGDLDRTRLFARRAGPTPGRTPYGAVFLIRDGHIVTVYTIDRFGDPPLEAYLWRFAEYERAGYGQPERWADPGVD